MASCPPHMSSSRCSKRALRAECDLSAAVSGALERLFKKEVEKVARARGGGSPPATSASRSSMSRSPIASATPYDATALSRLLATPATRTRSRWASGNATKVIRSSVTRSPIVATAVRSRRNDRTVATAVCEVALLSGSSRSNQAESRELHPRWP
jgi:hypothetical protein